MPSGIANTEYCMNSENFHRLILIKSSRNSPWFFSKLDHFCPDKNIQSINTLSEKFY